MGGGLFCLGESGEAGVAGTEVPGIVGSWISGNGGRAIRMVAGGFSDEVGRIGTDGHSLDVEGGVCGPGRGAVDTESHLGVEMMEGQFDVAAACLTAGVDFAPDELVIVTTVVVALYLSHDVWLGIFWGDHAVVAGLHLVGGVDGE